MTQLNELHPRTLCSIFAVALSGCLLKAGDLEAGLDDTADGTGNGDADTDDDTGGGIDPLECLTGSRLETIGFGQSVFEPECEVTCAEGWGHDDERLEIVQTLPLDPPFPDQPYQPRALGEVGNEDIVVAIDVGGAIDLQFFDPAASMGYGGYSVENLGSTIYSIEIDSEVLYVAHGDDDGSVELRAVDLASQQQLWAQSFVGDRVTEIARGGGKLAFVLVTDEDLSSNELVVLDLDGNAQWNKPTVESANAVAISPSSDTIAVLGDATRVYAAEDGELLDEFAHGFNTIVYPQSVTFADDDRVVTIGLHLEYERFDGWLAGNSLSGAGAWEHTYNRATAWCPEPEDDEWTAATTELLGNVTTLADGSLVVIGSENFEGGGVYGSHPWVARISADGEFLGSDRGLWDGFAIDSVAMPDGSVFVLIVEGPVTACEAPCDPSTQGFAVRKYVF